MHALTPTDKGTGPRCCECAMPLLAAAAWPQSTTFQNCPSCRVYLRVSCTAGRWLVTRAGRAASFNVAPLPLVASRAVREDFTDACRAIAQRLRGDGGVEPGMTTMEGTADA